MKLRFLLLLSLWGTLIISCALPPVTLTTPKPMQVDINMRVDVYQYAPNTKEKANKQSSQGPSSLEGRHNRRTDLQAFKNAQYIGERYDGFLTILNEPPKELGNYIRKTIEAENAERRAEMQSIAQRDKIPLSEVRRRQGEANRMRAFKGEWIENAYPSGRLKWIKKAAK